ncbi:MAG TPA: arabinose transporter [Flavilitoribacter sp.]|nr:arabinose transporter [Flavilitoribacter sp.]
MTKDRIPASGTALSVLSTLAPIVSGVFVAYLVIGLALPAIPLHVHDGLGLGAFVVGLVAGAQFTASLFSRFWSGHYADSRGGKRSMVVGLLVAFVAGLLYLLSLRFTDTPRLSVGILLVGRAILGAGESFIVSGALVWGLALTGPQNTGKVMAWVGMAMYIAFAAGAPAGTALYAKFGFSAIALASAFIPLVNLLLIMRSPAIAPAQRVRPSFLRVIGAVWQPGLGLAFSSLGFGAITTFIILLFNHEGWPLGWLALMVFATAFVLARLIFGHLADRFGGARIALIFGLIETSGLAVIWLSHWPAMALIGATIAGFGYSLVYPGFGVEAVRSAPSESKGLATGAYTAFLDLALGLANPALGLVAGASGLKSVFLVSTLVVLGSSFIAVRLLTRKSVFNKVDFSPKRKDAKL